MYQDERVTVRDYQVRMLHGGEGEPCLFLHGFYGVQSWLPFYEELSQHFHVYAPDHPGFGSSDTLDWMRNVEDVVLHYIDLINRLGLQKVHLVGHSIGGWIAAEFAVRYGERLKSVTLMSSLGVRVKGQPYPDIFYMPADEVKELMYSPEVLRELPEEDPFVQRHNLRTLARLAWNPRFFNPQLERRLERIESPSLLLWGAEDRLTPPIYGEVFHHKIAGSRLAVVEGCRHYLHVDRPQECASKIIQWIRG